MNLTPIKANMTELEVNGMRILFSYRTPVAMVLGMSAYRTERKWSATTTRHINTWLANFPQVWGAKYKPQEYFDNLIKEVK